MGFYIFGLEDYMELNATVKNNIVNLLKSLNIGCNDVIFVDNILMLCQCSEELEMFTEELTRELSSDKFYWKMVDFEEDRTNIVYNTTMMLEDDINFLVHCLRGFSKNEE